MKISIVTVCFNEEKNIKKTIESVLNQTSTDYEYIICDGGSKDNTVEIAKSYTDVFTKKGIHYVVNSEKDGGIYYGMNKGIDKASGDYIYFLNAGDWFYSDNVVEKIVDHAIQNHFPDVIYGSIATVERNVISVLKGNDEGLYERMTICHQAVFASTKLMKERPFNVQYRIMADYDFLLGLKLDKKSFSQINLVIAYFSVGGVSSVNASGFIKDLFNIRTKYNLKSSKSSEIKLRINIRKSTIASYIKLKIPFRLWYWWSIKIKKKTLLDEKR